MNSRVSVVGGAVLSSGLKFIAYEIIFPDKNLVACKTYITQWIQTAIYVCQLTDRMYVCQLMDECCRYQFCQELPKSLYISNGEEVS